MAQDFSGDLYNLADLSDEELRDLILQELQESPELDPGWIEVDVRDGFVTLSGSVGTDGEVQIVEKIVHDQLGVETYANELVVDDLHRGEQPFAADDAALADLEVDEQLGEPSDQHSDTAEHLMQDLEADTFGTHDLHQAIRDGTAYEPPDRPIPDGYGSREDH